MPACIRFFLYAAACLIATVHAAPIDVIKDALDRNPSLYIASYEGSPALRKQLISDLTVSDWFELVTTDKADYRMTVVHLAKGTSETMQISVVDAASKPVVQFTVRHSSGKDQRWMVHRAVDQVIEKIFQAPGICSSMLAFTKRQGNTKEIWMSDFDGTHAYRVTNNQTYSVEPAWSPNNQYLLYTQYGQSSTAIVQIDLRNRKHRLVTRKGGLNSAAAVSNSGKYVALTHSNSDNMELYIMRLSDGAMNRITHTDGVEASPVWSPDDQTLCYVSDAHSIRPTLYLIPSSGGRPKRLLSSSAEAVSPDWSGISNKLVFTMRVNGRYVLALLDMTEKNNTPKILTEAPGDWEAPSWLPDGRHVVCSRRVQGRQSLYMVDTLYGRATPLHAAGGEDSLPSASSLF